MLDLLCAAMLVVCSAVMSTFLKTGRRGPGRGRALSPGYVELRRRSWIQSLMYLQLYSFVSLAASGRMSLLRCIFAIQLIPSDFSSMIT
jgi:hypothetical protein